VQVPRITHAIVQQQVPVVTYPVQPYYEPMFIQVLFLMLFLVLPLLMIVPIFKALSKAIA
jgi:hypothetical protein